MVDSLTVLSLVLCVVVVAPWVRGLGYRWNIMNRLWVIPLPAGHG